MIKNSQATNSFTFLFYRKMDSCIPIGFHTTDENGAMLLANQSSPFTDQQPISFQDKDSVTSSYITNTSLNSRLVFKSPESSYEFAEKIIYTRVIVVICFFGLLGNFFNILVLTRKGLVKTMDRMEKSAHLGLGALAVSDSLFCLCVIPQSMATTRFSYKHFNFDLFYDMYGKILINVFIQCSTWLTVSMAVGRYVAICYPLQARNILGMTATRISIILVFIVSVLFNTPRFFINAIQRIDCMNGESRFYKGDGILRLSGNAELIYGWCYFLVGVILPLIILAYCNVYLIITLRESFLMRQQYRRPGSPSESKHRVTLTLVIIVVMFILLVIPSEIIHFFKGVIKANISFTDKYNLIISIFNSLQAVNFSFNFLLYCAVNEHFRATLSGLFCRRKDDSSLYHGVSTGHSVSRHTALSEV